MGKGMKSLYEPYKAPFAIYWEVVAGDPRLSVLQDHDLILCDYDLKIRQIDPVAFHEKRKSKDDLQRKKRDEGKTIN